MESPLKKILKEIQNEYGMDDEVIDPIIKKLNQEFYFKLKDIKNLSLEIWQKFGLPTNLYYILNELYQNANNQNLNDNNVNKNNNEDVNKINNNNNNINNINNINNNSINVIKESPQKIQQNQKLNLSKNSNEFNKENIHNHLAIIFAEIDNLDISKEVFQQLYKIINNINQNSNEQKFRKINITKFLSRYPYISIKNFLLFTGFQQDSDYLYLLGQQNKITQLVPELNIFIKEKKLAQSNFNPYQSSFASLSGNEEKIKNIGAKETNFEDLIKKEKERRQKLILNTKVDRNVKTYELNSNYSINNVIQRMNEIDDDLMSNSEDDKMIFKNSMDIIKKNQNDRFTLKSRLLFETLMKCPIYIKSDIRFKFPDNNIIEASFALYETIGDLYNFIKTYLNNPYEEFTISTTPPPKKYTKLNETIENCKLYPQVLMYVNFEKYSGLIKEKIEKNKIIMQ